MRTKLLFDDWIERGRPPGFEADLNVTRKPVSNGLLSLSLFVHGSWDAFTSIPDTMRAYGTCPKFPATIPSALGVQGSAARSPCWLGASAFRTDAFPWPCVCLCSEMLDRERVARNTEERREGFSKKACVDRVVLVSENTMIFVFERGRICN